MILYIAIGNSLFKQIFYRPAPMPTVDRSPSEIDQSDVIGKGRNWFYTNRMEYLNVRADAIDGVKLAGYFRPSADRSSKNVLILMHGYNEHPSMCAAYAKLFMSKIQCHVIIAHERAHGMSSGKFCSYGLFESMDVNTWIDYAKKQVGEDCRIFIIGRCMGGVAALLAAQQDDFSDNVAGIIVDSVYDNFEDPLLALGRRRYKLNLSFLLKWVKRCVRIRFGFDIDMCECASKAFKIKVPILMFCGEKDHIVDPQSTRRIYDNIKAGKRMVIVDGADHLDAYNKAPALYEKEVTNFIEKCCIRLVKNGRM
ncbi:MAG: lysophospholipase [Clostridia bacterium]|nr:lysophospholipase [Clostridia bacterium]